jgi:hypothetical protein
MGKLIRINKVNILTRKKLREENNLMTDTKGQILMFTGIRYERHIDYKEGISNHSRKRG